MHRFRSVLILAGYGLLLLAPALAMTIQAVRAQDTTDQAVDTATAVAQAADKLPALVYTMTVDGAIGTVTDSRIEEAINKADREGADLLVIFLDTPGGFTKPTWSINKNILNSPVPVCIYIAPSGARAGSAGVYMTYAAHFAAMAPSTNIGAAHPVAGGGQEVDSVMNEKITNDAVAQIKAAAEKRGRNVEWAEKAVRQSVSVTDNEALELNVIDVRADDFDDLMAKLDGRTTDLPTGEVTMSLKKVRTVELEMSLKDKLLSMITQPDVAFILMSIGSLGILLELYNPGAILPGVVGAISLLLALYAFQALPINYAGVALILLAIVLFIAEIKIVSGGLLTVGGLISFFLGGLMLIDTVEPALKVSLDVLITTVVILGIGIGLSLYLIIKAHKNRPSTGDQGMVGRTATVRGGGMVFIEGALWKVKSSDELQSGDEVEIDEVNGLTLNVHKKTT